MSDAEWADYLFMRKNPKGLHYERWNHARGCRRWFNVARDTVTHRISKIYKMGEQP
jgi:heterotetrameric sarcosine oxidase delta subunit